MIQTSSKNVEQLLQSDQEQVTIVVDGSAITLGASGDTLL
jgi:hypothetical protein